MKKSLIGNQMISSSTMFVVVFLLFAVSCTSSQFFSTESTTTQTIPLESGDPDRLLLIIHGANGRADTWPVQYRDAFNLLENSRDWQVFAVNWPEMSDRYLTASGNGQKLGEHLGGELMRHETNYKVLHIIASSLGSHVADGMVRRIREIEKQDNREVSMYIHVTFLDPFVPNGLLQPGYGIGNFGRGADFAESYFTKRDVVLFTNQPLRNAESFNLSPLVPDEHAVHFSYYHDFPIWWYLSTIGDQAAEVGFGRSPYFSYSEKMDYFFR